MQTHRVDELCAVGRPFGCRLVFHCSVLHCGESSSAVRLTVSNVEPPDASVAAMTAPSTIGALHTTTRPRRSASSISTAISLFVSTPPRSPRTTTPASSVAAGVGQIHGVTLHWARHLPRPTGNLGQVRHDYVPDFCQPSVHH